ncbi:MAG TPA: DUF397 domain-containing protein [Streptosporangiaceae bacterium]
MDIDPSRAIWRKSSFSNGSGGACVEVAAWRKSSFSNGYGGECVEVARDLPGVVAVRDSKDPQGPVLVVPPGSWMAFTSEVKAGRYDLP